MLTFIEYLQHCKNSTTNFSASSKAAGVFSGVEERRREQPLGILNTHTYEGVASGRQLTGNLPLFQFTDIRSRAFGKMSAGTTT